MSDEFLTDGTPLYVVDVLLHVQFLQGMNTHIMQQINNVDKAIFQVGKILL